MTRFHRAALCGLALAAAGCSGGPALAPVSGVVTLDGKPYPKAVVSFQPVGTKENPEPGRGSSAYTDENGRFVLRYDGQADGAVVGKHRVRIMTRGSDMVALPGGSSSDEGPAGKAADPIPADWSSESTKEFDVPPGGTDTADFAIESNKAKGKAKK